MAKLPDTKKKPPKPQVGAATPPPEKPPTTRAATQTPPDEPPKKPPSKTSTAPPAGKPPPPPSDTYAGRAAAQAVITRRLSDLSDDQLIAAFKADPRYILRQVRWLTIKENQQKYRLRLLINKNPSLKPILERTLARLPPPVQPRLKPEAKPEAAPPEVTAEELAAPEKPTTGEKRYTQTDAKKLQELINRLPDSYYDHYATKVDPETPDYISAQAAQAATQRLVNWLKFERGRFLPYLHGAFGETLKTALGPIGTGWRAIEKLERGAKLSSLHPALDSNAIYRFNHLLNQKALNVLLLPFSKSLGIVGKAGFSPFQVVFSPTPTYNEQTGRIESTPSTRIVFSPLFTLSRFGDKTADGIDKWTKRPTNFLKEHNLLEDYLENIDKALSVFNTNRKEYKKNKSEENKKKYKKSLKNIHRLVDSFDGFADIRYKKKGFFSKKNRQHNLKQIGLEFGNFLRGTTRGSLIKLSRNLRRTDRDPFSYLGLLIGGILFDLAAGFALNTVRYGLSRVINRIPGVNLARAHITKAIHQSPAATTVRIGAGNLKHALKAPFSLNVAASTYWGYQLGDTLFPGLSTKQIPIPFTFKGAINLPFPVNPVGVAFGAVTGGLGTFYQTALLNIIEGIPLTDLNYGSIITMPGLGAVPAQVHWYNTQIYGNAPQYRRLFGIGPKSQLIYSPTDLIEAETIAVEGYSAFEPIKTNIRHFQKPVWRKLFGPGPKATPLTRFTAFLYKSPYLRGITNGLLRGSFISSLLLRFLPQSLLSQTIAGIPLQTLIQSYPFINALWQIRAPFFADLALSLSRTTLGQSGLKNYARFHNSIINLMYQPDKLFRMRSRLFRGLEFLQPRDALKHARPWLTYARNIFNPGFFLGLLAIPIITPLGLPAFAAPVIGMASWWGAHQILNIIRPIHLSRFSALGYTGLILGSLVQLGLSLLGISLPISPLLWYSLWGLLTPLVIHLVLPFIETFGALLLKTSLSFLGNFLISFAGLGIDLVAAAAAAIGGITFILIAAGIVVIITFSAFFVSLQGDLTAGPQSTHLNLQTTVTDKQVCSDFTITQPILLKESKIQQPHIRYEALISPTRLKIDRDSLTASRNSQSLDRLPDQISINCRLNSSLTNTQYVALCWPFYSSVSGRASHRFAAALSAPEGPADYFALVSNYSELAPIAQVYIDFIPRLQQHHLNRQYLVKEYEAQLDVIKNNKNSQIKTLESITDYLEDTQSADSLESQLSYLNTALETISQNPFQNLINNLPNYGPLPEDTYDIETLCLTPWDTEENDSISSDQACLQHIDNLIDIYQAWDQPFSQVKWSINSLIDQSEKISTLSPTDPEYDTLVDQFNLNLSAALDDINYLSSILKEQFKYIKDELLKGIDDLYFVPGSLPENLQISDPEVQEFLKNFDFFQKQYYFIPQGTDYQICYDVENLTDQPVAIFTSVYIPYEVLVIFTAAVSRANETIIIPP